MALTRKAIGSIVIELCVNVVLPYFVYVLLEARLGQVHALLAASLPPILWSAIEFARKRRIDAVSILVLAGIILSLLAFFGGGSARFLQLRENLVTGLIGLAFLGSATIGHPLIYQLARAGELRKSPADANRFEALREKPQFRRGMTIMTVVWGLGLLGQTIVACLLVFRISIRHYLIVSPIIGYGTMGILALWTVWYVKQMKQRGRAAAANLRS